MNERLKMVREALKISTREFASRLGMSNGTISMIENGQRSLTNRFVIEVCREFDVNETWLRTGEGDMFAPKTWEEEVADITVKIFKEDNEFRKKLISLVASLSDEELDLLQRAAEKLVGESKK